MNKKQKKTTFFLNPKLYSLEAIYGAAYVFLDKAYIYLDGSPKSKIKITLKAKKGLKESKNLKEEFLNELLNFSLRDQVSKNNKKIRERIVGTVLSIASSPLEKNETEEDLMFKEKTMELEQDFSKMTAPWCKTGSRKKTSSKKKTWRKDPAGIMTPWEKKRSSKRKKK